MKDITSWQRAQSEVELPGSMEAQSKVKLQVQMD